MSNKLPAQAVKERLARMRQRGYGAKGFLANLLGPTDYITYVERMIRSEHVRPIQAPPRILRFVKRAVAESQSIHNNRNRKRDVSAKANAYKTLRGWRAEYPHLALEIAEALGARAAVKGKSSGRPRGTMRVDERTYVDRAYSDLAAFAEIVDYRGLDAELRKPGRGNQPSPARRLLCEEARRIAKVDGKRLNSKRLSSAVRRFARVL